MICFSEHRLNKSSDPSSAHKYLASPDLYQLLHMIEKHPQSQEIVFTIQNHNFRDWTTLSLPSAEKQLVWEIYKRNL